MDETEGADEYVKVTRWKKIYIHGSLLLFYAAIMYDFVLSLYIQRLVILYSDWLTRVGYFIFRVNVLKNVKL